MVIPWGSERRIHPVTVLWPFVTIQEVAIKFTSTLYSFLGSNAVTSSGP